MAMKLYTVQIGILDGDTDVENERAVNVVAVNVQSAMRLVELNEGEYFSDVRIVAVVDIS